MDEILAARGITVRHETTRQWALKVRPEHRQSEPPQAAPCWRDMAPRRGCREDRRKKHWLWRAVDQDGDVIMTVRVSRRKSWFLGVVLALAPIAAFGEDIDGQINQLLEKIRQQDTTSGNLTELIKLVDETIPLIMKAPPESLDRIRELSALIERKSALSGVGQAESAGGQAGGMAGPGEADSAVPAPPGTASSAPMPTAEPVVPQAAAATSSPADTAAASAGRRVFPISPVQAQAIAAPPSSVLPGPPSAPSDKLVLSAADPRGRFERVEGRPVAMAPEYWVHARLKARIWRALDRQITEAGLPCQAVPNGMALEIYEGTNYELVDPDALVNCGPPMPDDAVAAPNPVIVVEVLSPGTASRDAGGKLADYFRVASIQHYLLVRPNRREVIHHRRMGERIETSIVRKDTIVLDPPGLRLAIEEIYGP
jgi:Uma2 family endonuclease